MSVISIDDYKEKLLALTGSTVSVAQQRIAAAFFNKTRDALVELKEQLTEATAGLNIVIPTKFHGDFWSSESNLEFGRTTLTVETPIFLAEGTGEVLYDLALVDDPTYPSDKFWLLGSRERMPYVMIMPKVQQFVESVLADPADEMIKREKSEAWTLVKAVYADQRVGGVLRYKFEFFNDIEFDKMEAILGTIVELVEQEHGQLPEYPSESEEPVEVERLVFDATITSLAVEPEGLVITAKMDGENPERLEVRHTLEVSIPALTLYASEENVWGDSASEAQAEYLGLEAKFEDGVWTLTFLSEGQAYSNILEEGEGLIGFTLTAFDGEGNHTHDPEDDNYLHMAIDLNEVPVDPEDDEDPVDPTDPEDEDEDDGTPTDPEDDEDDDEEPVDPVDPEDDETEEPTDPEDEDDEDDTEEPVDPVDPEDEDDEDETPVDPEDDTEEPVDPIDPEDDEENNDNENGDDEDDETTETEEEEDPDEETTEGGDDASGESGEEGEEEEDTGDDTQISASFTETDESIVVTFPNTKDDDVLLLGIAAPSMGYVDNAATILDFAKEIGESGGLWDAEQLEILEMSVVYENDAWVVTFAKDSAALDLFAGGEELVIFYTTVMADGENDPHRDFSDWNDSNETDLRDMDGVEVIVIPVADEVHVSSKIAAVNYVDEMTNEDGESIVGFRVVPVQDEDGVPAYSHMAWVTLVNEGATPPLGLDPVTDPYLVEILDFNGVHTEWIPKADDVPGHWLMTFAPGGHLWNALNELYYYDGIQNFNFDFIVADLEDFPVMEEDGFEDYRMEMIMKVYLQKEMEFTRVGIPLPLVED